MLLSAMASSISLVPLLLLLLVFPPPSSPVQITLRLTATAAPPSPSTPWQKLHHFTSKSSKLPLFPENYGGYSVSLGIGTPPQKLSFIMDTGTSLSWFPCTRRYSCSSCNHGGSPRIAAYLPEMSSSFEVLSCGSSQCRWVFPDVQCSRGYFCPSYVVQYGSGSTFGVLVSETLTFQAEKVRHFVAGCSSFSSKQPAGVLGFGRGAASLPAQIGLKRFSYCMANGKPVISYLTLDFTGGVKSAAVGLSYTPFRKNPKSNASFEDYYYVTIKKITVGNVDVDVPYKLLVPNSEGHGGAIVDSGTTFTLMEMGIFEAVKKEFENQVKGNYSRDTDVERISGLRPCFKVSDGSASVAPPKLSFHFNGGLRLDVPLGDYFSFMEESILCMTVVSSGGGDGGGSPGPAVILGNYQQRNVYVEFDLENERLGFHEKKCDGG